MDTIQEDDIDEDLKDFMTNFKFPWESEDDRVTDTNDNGGDFGIKRVCHRSSGHVYLSDTTPARRGKCLSGKNLTKEYSLATSPITADRCLVAQRLEDTVSTKGIDLSEELNHVTTHESNLENENQAKDSNQTDQFVGDVCSISCVTDENDSLLQTNKKKKRRQSSYFKRRESLALLKTIGEVSSPCCKDKLQQDSSSLQDLEEKLAKCNARSQRVAKKSKARTSRRRSTRLSGISHPMLELGTNGIPKLVQPPASSLLQSMPLEAPESIEEHQTPIPPSEEPFEKNENGDKLQNTEQELGYRHNIESPIPPLQNSVFVTGDMDSQYYTPQNYKASKVELCTPEQSVLTSLSSLQLQTPCPSDSIKEHDVDNCSRSESLGKTPEETPYQQISDGECNMLEATKEINTKPEKDGEEQILKENDPKCESLVEGCLGERRETEMDISEWKENLDDTIISILSPSCHTRTSSTSSLDEIEVDPKVKEIYLKKGQLKPFKRTNTNLETVFEEQKTDVVSFGKRKYRRSLAFPEKPWVPRNSKRGAKKQKGCRKKRLSLSRTSKTNDAVLGERLDNILDSLVEES